MCGEQLTQASGGFTISGSSPRVWGTGIPIFLYRKDRRFIPTCVGNSRFITAIKLLLAVHPHVCGEQNDNLQLIVQSAGSSPRVWGTDEDPRQVAGIARFIPTCVGNSIYD